MKKWIEYITVALLIMVPLTGMAEESSAPPPDTEKAQLSPPDFRRPPGPPRGPSMGFHPLHFQHLTLSKEQQEKIAALEKRSARETKELKYKLDQKRLEMGKMFSDPGVSESTLLKKQKELNALSEKLHDKQATAMIKTRSVLTSDQISKLDQMPPLPPHGRRDMMEPPPQHE